MGKTTLAVNLAAVLARDRKVRVLLVDTDPSGNASAHFRVKPQATLYHVLMEGHPVEKALVHLEEYGNLFLLPSSKATQAAEFQIAPQLGRERVLEKRLAGLSGFDFVILDTAPSLSIMAQNAYVYARRVLIPVSMDPMSLLGAASSLALAQEIREKLRVKTSVVGLVPTFVQERLVVTRLVMQALSERYSGIPLLPGIRSDTGVRKATASQVPVVVFDPSGRASQDFVRLAEALGYGRTRGNGKP